jgi:hypothetical protein
LSIAKYIAHSSGASLEIPLRASFDAFAVPFGHHPLLGVPCQGLVDVVLHEGLVGVVMIDSLHEVVGIILILVGLLSVSVVIVLRNNTSLTGDVSVIPYTTFWLWVSITIRILSEW